MLKYTFSTLLLLSLCCIAQLPVHAQDVEKPAADKKAEADADAEDVATYDLQPQFSEGQVITIVQIVNTLTEIEIEGMAAPQTQEMWITMYNEYEILKVNDEGTVTQFQVAYKHGEIDEDGTEHPLNGIIVTHTWDKETMKWSGKLHEDSKKIDAEMGVDPLAIQSHSFYGASVAVPDKAIAVGDSWEGSDAYLDFIRQSASEGAGGIFELTLADFEASTTLDSVEEVAASEFDGAADDEDDDAEESDEKGTKAEEPMIQVATLSGTNSYTMSLSGNGISLTGDAKSTMTSSLNLTTHLPANSTTETVATFDASAMGMSSMVTTSTVILAWFEGRADDVLAQLMGDDEESDEDADDDSGEAPAKPESEEK